MRKLRWALIIGLVLAIPATAFAYYELSSSGCPVTEGCDCSH